MQQTVIINDFLSYYSLYLFPLPLLHLILLWRLKRRHIGITFAGGGGVSVVVVVVVRISLSRA